ncbi:uncharacterized protein LOC112043258 [Bicyclus anynana]|uniref:Uncharacterized protein LOC112043258 n=1 Tax=Bicyclus anynana TaxID=110368 RepID=A0A6J1MGP8_BICAN|nr:uncharacterized protein LOC112043258 [Bicyclus anynana]
MIELEEVVSKLRWYVTGLSEIRRNWEDSITFESDNLFYYREGDQLSQGDNGLIVCKSLVNNESSVLSKVAYLIHRITERYSMMVIQVYAPTSTQIDEDVEVLYEDISKAIHASHSYYNIEMGDFNAKLDVRSGSKESSIWLRATEPQGPSSGNHHRGNGLG